MNNKPRTEHPNRTAPGTTPVTNWGISLLVAVGALLLATTAHAKKDPVVITNVNGTVGAASTTLYISGENFTDGVFEPVLTLGMDGLTRLFSNASGPLQVLRNLGLGVVARSAVARRGFMGIAAGEAGDVPRLLRGEAL